jgi:hypothetical protein
VRSQLIGHETTDVYGVFLQAKPDEAFFRPTETIGAAFSATSHAFHWLAGTSGQPQAPKGKFGGELKRNPLINGKLRQFCE